MPLTALLALQDHDILLEQARHRRANLPEATKARELTAARDALAARLAELAASQADLGGQQEALERDITTSRTKQADLAKRLAATSVPREAQTFQHEIDTAHQRQTELEDRELELMEALEPIDTEAAELAQRLTVLDEDLTVARAELAVREADTDSELAALVAARVPLAEAVGGDALASYEAKRARLGGVAVARLVNGSCTGCHMQLSSSELQQIRLLPEGELAECEQCGRLLAR